MLSLKRNGKLVDALGTWNRISSVYTRNQAELFRISRSKFTDFLNCTRCFYLDRVKGLISPSRPEGRPAIAPRPSVTASGEGPSSRRQ